MSSASQSSELFLRVTLGSVLFAVLLLNFVLLLVGLLRRNTRTLNMFSAAVLLLLLYVGMARAFLPLEFDFSQELPVPPFVSSEFFFRIFIHIWSLGAIASACYWLFRLLREVRTLRQLPIVENSQLQRLAVRMGLRHVRLTVSPTVSTPCIIGFFRPHIFMPPLELSDHALEWVIRHELTHYMLHDPYIKAAYLLLMVLFWWNPAVYPFRAELDRLLELRCDAVLTRSSDLRDRQSYLSTLLEIIRQTNGTARTFLFAANMATLSDQYSIKQRFRVIMDHKEPSSQGMHLAILLALGVALASYLITF